MRVSVRCLTIDQLGVLPRRVLRRAASGWTRVGLSPQRRGL